jgi:hypothetical protein
MLRISSLLAAGVLVLGVCTTSAQTTSQDGFDGIESLCEGVSGSELP